MCAKIFEVQGKVEDVGVCQPLKILGYEVIGEIKAPSGNPMSNVLVTITHGSDPPIKIRSDKAGKFSSRLPNGNYKIRAEADDKTVKIGQPEKEAIVNHQNLQLDPFLVQTFSVTGKVQTGSEKGQPFPSAKVSVTHDGKTVDVTTSKDGSFTVDNVRNGPVSAKVSAEGYDFDIVTLNNVDPGVNFPTISPARYLLTGKVDRDSLPADTEVSILSILNYNNKYNSFMPIKLLVPWLTSLLFHLCS